MEYIKGHFYEFHRERAVSAPGQELRTLQGVEIGPEIQLEKQAIRQASLGKDVYTPWKFDAYKLAIRVVAKAPECEGAHDDFFYPHYHPGGKHAEIYEEREGRPRAENAPGHIFFGMRGQSSGG